MSACALLAVAAIVASGPDEAERRFRRAVALHDVADYQGALAEFLAVYELRPRPGVLFNVALEQVKLERPVEAAETLERLLAAPGTMEPTRVARARAMLSAQLAQLGELVLVAERAPEELVVEVDNVTQADVAVGVPLRVKAGRRHLTVLARDALPLRLVVDVAPGTRREIALTLKRSEQRPARLELSCDVPGTTFVLDEEPLGQTPFTGPVVVAPGRHLLSAERAGYLPFRRELELAEGEVRPVVVGLALDPQGARGVLTLEARDAPLVATVDGVPVGAVLAPLRLPPGAHRLRLERGGFFPVERQVDVDPQRPTVVRVALELTAEGRAELEARASRHRFWGTTLTGAGGVLAAGGLVTTVLSTVQLGTVRAQLQQQQENDARSPGCCDADIRASAARVTALEWWQAGGVTAASVGGALLGAGVYAFVTAPDLSIYDRPPDVPELSLLVGEGAGVVVVRGSF